MERLLDFLQTHRDALIVGLVVAAVGAVVARSRRLIVQGVQRLAAAYGRRWVNPRIAGLRRRLLSRPVRVGPGLAVRILEACNAEAAALYRSRMRNEPGTERQVAIWETTFERAWTPQRAFVEPQFEVGSGERLRGMIAAAAERGGCVAWIRAAAGAGKTTLVTRLFFELVGAVDDTVLAPRPGSTAPARPVPMLVQPLNLRRNEHVRDLLEASSDREWLEALISVWLRNRGIEVPAALLPDLAQEFERSLRAGEILLLLDGYDEFDRMGLRRQAKRLLGSPMLVGSDRSDETREKPERATEFRLEGAWPSALQRQYVTKRWGATALHEWIEPVLKRLGRADADWLARPRILEFLLRVFEKTENRTLGYLDRLTSGEFELLDLAFQDAFGRLERVAANASLSLDEAAERLAVVAAAQYRGATFVLPAGEKDEQWSTLEQLTDIVTWQSLDDGEHAYIEQPMFRDFFLGRRIADELRGRRLPSIGRRWSHTTLSSASAVLRLLETRAADLVWSRLADAAARDGAASAPLSLNLFDLAVRIELDRAAAAEPGRERLALRRQVRVVGRLRDAAFDFRDCRFLDGEGASALRVEGMQIAEAELVGGTDVTRDELARAGAAPIRSRYRFSMANLFSRHQGWLLGADYARLETEYVRMICDTIARCAPAAPVYMIDLMAGGSNDRLLALIGTDDGGATAGDGGGAPASIPNLHVLAVDRDTTKLDALGLPPDRFRALRVELHGGHDLHGDPLPREGNVREGIDLAGALAGFAREPRRAHLVIGKKAIHEIPRELQPLLLRQATDVLAEHGSLILFTDSPGRMSEDARRQLEDVRTLLRTERRDTGEVRRALRTRTFDIGFGAAESDVALFCNLWVMLKDRANENEHEYCHRFFASRAEIVEWVEQTGCMRLREGEEIRGRYRLAPARFNEAAVRAVGDLLDRRPDAVDEAWTIIRRRLLHAERESLSLLADFTHHHLLDAAGSPTPLGAVLDARIEHVGFRRMHASLARSETRDEDRVQSLAFDFPVHVLAFDRVE